jgi:hypothetical protein
MIILLSLLGYIFSLYLIFKKYLEFLPYFVVSVIITTIYVFGLYGEMFGVAKTVFWLGITLFPISILLFLRNKAPIYSILTPGLVLFAAFFLFLAVKLDNHIFTAWDEVSHWGLVSKVMFTTGGFLVDNSIVTKPYYPPGANIFHCFTCINSWGDFEGNVYVAHLMLVLAPLAAIFYQIRWKHWLKILLILFASHIVITKLGLGYRSIYVDHVLSVHFAMIVVIYLYIREQPRWHLLLLAPMLFVLPAIKETGYMLAWFAVIIVATDQSISFLRKKEEIVIGICILALLALMPFLSHYSWQKRLSNLEMRQKKSPVQFSFEKVRELFSEEAPGKSKEITTKFKSATLSYLPARLTIISSLFLFAAVGGSCRKYGKMVLLVYCWLTIFLVLYSLGLLYLYLFRFGAYEGIRLASYDRYMDVFLAAFALVGLGVVVADNVTDIRLGKNRVSVSVFLLIICVVAYGFRQTRSMPVGLYRFLRQPTCYRSKGSERRAGFRETIRDKVEFTKARVEQDEKVYIIYQNSKGYHYHAFKYGLYPISSRAGNWSLGKPYYEGDVWTRDITIEQWSGGLKRWDYVLLGNADARFWKDYGDLFVPAQNEEDVFLYKVTKKQSQQVQLLPVY